MHRATSIVRADAHLDHALERRRCALSAVGAALLILLACPPARAQPEAKRAVAGAMAAVELYERGDWAEAFEGFEAADRMAHSPVFVLYMARCKRNLGKLLDAQALYERVGRDELPGDATDPMKRAKEDAAIELPALRARIPSVVVSIPDGSNAPDLRIAIDGGSPRARPTQPIPLDPGEHRIDAFRGKRTGSATVHLAEGGGVSNVSILLSSPAPPVADTTRPHPAPPPAIRGSIVPGAIVLGTGIVALGVGAVTGALAAARAHDIHERCDGNVCLAKDEPASEDAKDLATVATIGFVAAGVLGAAGTVLLIVRPGSSAKTSAAVRVAPTFAKLHVAF